MRTSRTFNISSHKKHGFAIAEGRVSQHRLINKEKRDLRGATAHYEKKSFAVISAKENVISNGGRCDSEIAFFLHSPFCCSVAHAVSSFEWAQLIAIRGVSVILFVSPW